MLSQVNKVKLIFLFVYRYFRALLVHPLSRNIHRRAERAFHRAMVSVLTAFSHLRERLGRLLFYDATEMALGVRS